MAHPDVCIPSMPAAAPKAIQMAWSPAPWHALPRVLLRMAPAAEPATVPKKPMALYHAPAARHPACTTIREQLSSHGEVRLLEMLLLLRLASATSEAHGFGPCTCDHTSCSLLND